jgi:hypothetical protein
MSLLNFTTKIPAAKTVSDVTQILVRGGARQIMSEFDSDGNASGVSFSIDTPMGIRGFTLPVHAEPILYLLKEDTNPTIRPHHRTLEHAHNVAWRIIKDWLEAQMALIETEMVTFDQVMLPYMRSVEGTTLYEQYINGHVMQPSLGVGS